ncbi:MAG: hypothetical protein L7T24_08645, partial [Luminiphilus sp.]|nr:hypothetical protein [Luminiphilus sp.]
MDTHIAAGWPKIWGLLLLSLCPVTATADTPATVLSPYEATYRTKAMGMTMSVERKLVPEASGYRLSSVGSSFLASLTEIAHF